MTKPTWSEFGYEFEGFAQIAVGAAIGATVGFFGGILDIAAPDLGWRWRGALLSLSIICGGLFALAVSSLFMFIDADGPQGFEPYVRAACLPAAVGLLARVVPKSRPNAPRSAQARR